MFSFSKSALACVTAGLFLSGCQSVPEKSTAQLPSSIEDSTSPELQHADLADSQVAASLANAEPTQPVDLWTVTRNHMHLPLHLDKKRVQVQLKWYAKHPAYIKRVMNRAKPYYYHIVTEAIKRDIPLELALLPVVESAFDPFAYSHGRAAGPWQFIPSTGKHFGLKQTWWYDGRRDILKSTDAAYTFLSQLNKRFDGDWLLALAAYNAGGGTISKAIRRNKRAGKPTDFWSLKLPKETMAYVPKVLAIAELVKHSEQYAITLPTIPNEPYFASIDTQSQIDLAHAAEMAGISTKELYLLNPGFNRWATDPEGPHNLLIPVAKAELFEQKLAALPVEERLKWARYKVKSGDSLIAIAKKHRTTVAQIKSTNKLKNSRIRAGQTLLISTASQQATEYALSQQQRHSQKQKAIARTTDRRERYYHVKSGDSFWSIARKYQVGVRQLARWNSMAPGDPLQVGKRLVIWSQPTQQALSSNDRQIIRKVGYQVRSGDSLSRIASKFSVRVADILRWNKINSASYLQPGQRLTLFVDITNGH